MNVSSYTAANSFPWKIYKDFDLLESIYYDGIILPRHVQLSPTNKCNLHCSFCSCEDRDRSLEWTFEDVIKIVNILVEQQCAAVTITGGGEPLLFPHIGELITGLRECGIQVGLVSNGIAGATSNTIRHLRWCRFSFSDERNFDNNFIENVLGFVAWKVDVAFSYVVTNNPNLDNIRKIVDFANKYNFTHVRMVSDILDNNTSHILEDIQRELKNEKIDDSKIIYQPRASFTTGREQCLISLLKPMIYSDGYVYPCCGAQYALLDEQKRMPNKMRMGHYTDLPEIIAQQQNFNGSVCSVCYYKHYNDALIEYKQQTYHEEFI